jgi:hypothetical protein
MSHPGSATRFSGQNPCPICDTGSKSCHRTGDGLIFCRGRGDGLAKGDRHGEFAFVGRDKNDTFFLWKVHEQRASGFRMKTPRSSGPPPQDLIDWDDRLAKAKKHLSEDRKAALARTLGVPLAAILRLSPGVEFTGVYPDMRTQYAFPMTGGDGRLGGLAHRDAGTGEKKAAPGSRLGVFAPAGWKESEGTVFIPEGASDTAALVAMGLPALGRPSAKAGAQAVADLLHGSDREVVVLGEMDPKETGEWPGRDGAVSTAKKLAAALGREVRWSFPPGGAKDVREWFKARGLDPESDLDSCHAAGEEFVAGLKLQTVKPPEGGEESAELIESEDDVPTLADVRAAGAEMAWVWPGWIQAGVVNGLVGEFGGGKTRFVAELIRRVRSGEPWPDGSPMTLPADSRFLIVPADHQQSELCQLATDYGIPDDCIFLNSSKGEPLLVSLFDSKEAVACLERRVEVVRPALVIVDPVTGVTTSLNHGRAEDATALYGPLMRIGRKYGVSVWTLIHTNAQGGTYGRHGTGKFRTEVKLTKFDMGGEERYRLEVTKTNAKKPPPLGATQRDHRWDFDGNPPAVEPEARRPGPKPKAVEEAVAFLHERLAAGEALQCEVVTAWEQAGHSPKSVFAAARQMLQDGDLREGLKPSPKGNRQLKTWTLTPIQEVF